MHRKVPQNLFRNMVWLCLNACGQLWRRFVYPYSLPPLSLGKLCDPHLVDSSQRDLAKWYFNLPSCCRSQSFCEPLLQHVHDPADLCRHGKLHGALESCFRTTSVTIECENNFARAQSAKQATRGRSDHSCTLAAKHILAEIKAVHKKDLQRHMDKSYMADTRSLEHAEKTLDSDEPTTSNLNAHNVILCYSLTTYRHHDPGRVLLQRLEFRN